MISVCFGAKQLRNFYKILILWCYKKIRDEVKGDAI
mgnify:CR=1 FL=1